jgi:protein TonB
MKDAAVRPDDLLELFEIGLTATAAPETARPEPVLAAAPFLVEFDGSRQLDPDRLDPARPDPDRPDPDRLDPARAVAEPETPPPAARRTVLPLGLIGSLGLHLLPLLVLIHWNSAPAEIDAPIPVQLVIVEPPPPPPPAPAEKPPPRGRLASIDIGEPAMQPEQPDAAARHTADQPGETVVAAVLPPPKPQPSPELVSALPKPVPEPEPDLTPVEPKPAAPPVKATPKHIVAARLAPNPYPAPRSTGVPGPAATRDEYLAHCTMLVERHNDLLPAALIANRRGVTVLSVLVYDDGTIGRIAVARSSGYPDIDARVERMVAAVRRFPPLPQWIQESSKTFAYHHAFP